MNSVREHRKDEDTVVEQDGDGSSVGKQSLHEPCAGCSLSFQILANTLCPMPGWGGVAGSKEAVLAWLSSQALRLGRVNSLLLWGSFYLTGLKSLFEFLKPFNLKSPGRCAIGFSFKLINKIGLCLSLLRFVLKQQGFDLSSLETGGSGWASCAYHKHLWSFPKSGKVQRPGRRCDLPAAPGSVPTWSAECT